MNVDKAVTCGITCEKLRKLEHITAETDKINKELDAICLAVSEKAAIVMSSFIFATTVVYLHIWFCI